ncbi:trypsin-like serine protease [bacterium]|nr:trypsin-like serine protease [bacterium]
MGAFAGICLAATAMASEQVRLDPGRQARIVNGVHTHAYPTTGALLYGGGGAAITSDNAYARCSGTLIGCRTFLVAAHCVDDDPRPDHYWVYLQHAGISAVSRIVPHPDSTPFNFPLSDVAVVQLADWVTGIAPTPLNTVDPVPFIPAVGTIVGFGQTQGNGNDYGIKRAGTVLTAPCPEGLPSNATDADVVCWNFLGPLGAPGTNSNTCNGDSGGPLLLNLGGGEVVAGVTSGGMSSNCLPSDTSYDASVFAAQSFLVGALAGDDTAACGGLPPIGAGQNTVAVVDDTLDAVDVSDSFTLNVPPGANALRVALNGKDDGLFDVDLYVKQGSGAGPGNFDCKADGHAVFGACTIDHPAAGPWSVAAVRTLGAGEYQITSTVFGGAAPVCGNGTREFDEDCDGSDAALCAGLCQGDCRCPAPVCGNGVKERGEQCDGAAATLCPGACRAGCTCPPPCTSGDLFDVSARLDARRLKLRSRLLNFAHAYDGADPRRGFSLALAQGANTLTIAIPANDPGWSRSRPEKGRYQWAGAANGINGITIVDRSARQGIWKLVIVGKNVPGAGAFDLGQPIDVRLTIDDRCTDDSF